jgi:hypothetical protein
MPKVKILVKATITTNGVVYSDLNGNAEQIAKMGLNPADFPVLGPVCKETLESLGGAGTKFVPGENYNKPFQAPVQDAPAQVSDVTDEKQVSWGF